MSLFRAHPALSAFATLVFAFSPALAYASVSVSIQSLSPSTTISVGTTLSFSATASGFTSPIYSLSDSFGGSSISNGNIDSSGNVTWTPNASDAGTHTLTIGVNDASGDGATTTEEIVVSAPVSVSVQSLSPGTSLSAGTTVSFSIATTGFTSPSYSVSDSFGGSSVTSGDINSSGVFSWTPTNGDVGTHNLTIYVNDSSGHSGNVTLALTVQTPNLAITSIYPGSVVSPGEPLSFTVASQGFTSPSYTLSDSFSGTSITNSDINSSGSFEWTPDATQDGTHTITVYATDSYGHSANTSITIDVNSGTTATVPSTTNSGTLASLESELAQVEGEISSMGGTSATTSGFQFENYLSPGLTSPDVTQLQTLLAQQGDFSGTPTGYYGTETENAVIAFQAAHGIEQLGVVGPATRAALNQLLASASTSTTATGDGYVFSNFIGYGDTSNDVTELQKRLTALGVYSGPITGYFGDATKSAVEQLQAAHGISQVGYVGPGTRSVLNGQ